MDRKIYNHVSSVNVPDWGNKKQFIGIHYLGCVGQNWDLAADGTGAHYTIFWNGDIHQRCSHDAVPWAVGTAGGMFKQKHPKANNYNTISIELCVKKTVDKGINNRADDTDWYFTQETQEACVWLVQKLMKDLGIPADHVLRHYDIVDKWCPAPYCLNNKYKTSWSWDEFLAKVKGESVVDAPTVGLNFYRVRKTWEDAESQLGAYSELERAKEACPFGFSVFDPAGKKVFTRKTEANKDEIWMGWTIRETGSAGLRCIHGDAGKAYGLQFDYRYGLVPFMQYCVAYNPDRYKGFNLYIQMGAGSPNLVYNEGLGNLWKDLYDKYTEEFSQLQLTCAYQQYYIPAKDYILKHYGIDLDDHSPAVKGSVWSMSFRSGQETGAKKWAHSAGLTDEEMMLRAYTTYGSEDGGRWLPQGQLGDALLAYANWEFTTINKTMEGGVIAQNPEPVPSDKPAEPVQEKGAVVYRVQIGFFNKKPNAENKAASYRNKGIDCIVKPKGDGYMIQAGVYDLKVSAEKRVDTLKKNKVLKQQKITPFYFEDAQ